MKKILLVIIAICIISFVPAVGSFAQGMVMGFGGWSLDSRYGKMYDPRSIETISGEVMRVDMITPLRGMSKGVRILVKSEKGSIAVHLGPAWYLESQDVRIRPKVRIMPKDRVEIKGSRITFKGKPAIIAAEVKKGDEVLKLRDESGYPVWSGKRRR
jgi:hypothetical protein